MQSERSRLCRVLIHTTRSNVVRERQPLRGAAREKRSDVVHRLRDALGRDVEPRDAHPRDHAAQVVEEEPLGASDVEDPIARAGAVEVAQAGRDRLPAPS